MTNASPSPNTGSPVRKTPLHAWHVANGGRMVSFAGYELPVQYRAGLMQEHIHTRTAAGLFDVSHMGVAYLTAADGRQETVAAAFEQVVPCDVAGLKPGQQRYTQFLNDEGGIRDDLMVWRPHEREGQLGIIVNAACKEADFAFLQERMPASVVLAIRDDLALFALQGPAAEALLAASVPQAAELKFLQVTRGRIGDAEVSVHRSGYTGEDGYEIAVPAEHAVAVWERFTADPRVLPIGLGARDSLRLEAGLCLYGHDMDPSTSPVEANLAWSMQKRRRQEGGFCGADRIQRELREGPARLRVGLKPVGRAPVREGAPLFDGEASATPVGRVTSGGYGPTLAAPIAMGYVPPAQSSVGTRLFAEVRGQRLPVDVHALPFVPSRCKR